MKGRIVSLIILAAFLFSTSTAFAEPNLVGWWEFDEGGGSVAGDSSGNGNNGTITGATWFEDPFIGMCLDFDGSGNYVTVGDSASMQSIDGNTAEYTICMWVRTTQSGAPIWDEKAIFDRRSIGGTLGENDWVAHIYLNENNAMGLFIRDRVDGNDVTLFLDDNLAINNGYWRHIAAVRKGTEYVKIYVDGDLRQSGSTTASPTTTDITTIGVRRTNLNSKTGYFDGKIDDVRIYNRALTTGEIEQLYSDAFTKASIPNPFNGATEVDPNVILSWRPGRDAVSHDVYLGTDFNDVNDADMNSPEYKGNFDVNYWDPCGLEIMTAYYWRVDEVNDSNLWRGNVWRFETIRPFIELSATEFEFYAIEGGANPDSQILGISNSGAGVLNWQISCDCNWLSAEPNSGSSAGEVNDVTLSVDISGLAAGIYDCNLIISDENASNNPQVVYVLIVIGPEIELSATQFGFHVFEPNVNPDDQILGISNSGAGVLNWQISWDCNWLSVEPNSGSSTGEINTVTLSVDISGLNVGSYYCNLTISDPNAFNSPQIVGVNLYYAGPGPDCMAVTNPAYDNWVYWGKPDCWCYARQCRGDADGLKFANVFWISGIDLNILKGAISRPEISMPEGGECADFDHEKFANVFWVSGQDLYIMKNYISKPEGAIPKCGNPPDPNYNFWCSPAGCPAP